MSAAADTRLTRETFATPRAAEFFERSALQAQTGRSADEFAAVLVKELLDNALDAAETAGVAPESRSRSPRRPAIDYPPGA